MDLLKILLCGRGLHLFPSVGRAPWITLGLQTFVVGLDSPFQMSFAFFTLSALNDYNNRMRYLE